MKEKPYAENIMIKHHTQLQKVQNGKLTWWTPFTQQLHNQKLACPIPFLWECWFGDSKNKENSSAN